MSDSWICTAHSAQEKDQVLSALKQAGIPVDHVTVSPPMGQDNDRSAGVGEVDGEFWPIADGALSGCIGGAFGAYVGAFTMLIPGIRQLHDLGPVSLILGSAALCAAIGLVMSLIINACVPDHLKQHQGQVGRSTLVTMAIHGDDGRESQLIHEVLVATGHGDSVHAPG
jgi:hypothetical protein